MEFNYLKITYLYPELVEGRQTDIITRIERGDTWHKKYADALWALSSECSFCSDDMIIVRPCLGKIHTQPVDDDEYEYQWLIILYFKDDRKPLALWDIDVCETYGECEEYLQSCIEHNVQWLHTDVEHNNCGEVEFFEKFITVKPRRHL